MAKKRYLRGFLYRSVSGAKYEGNSVSEKKTAPDWLI